MKNGAGKILKWLWKHGIKTKYVEYQKYAYYDNFHANATFGVDCWQLSDGMYLKAKCNGRARYYLCDSLDKLTVVKGTIGFSQDMFIEGLERYFRECGGNDGSRV